MRVFMLLVISVTLSAQTGPDAAWAVLDGGIGDTNPAKRADVLLAMSVMLPDPHVTGTIEGLLQDKDVSVRQAACTVLGEMKARASMPKLRQALDDKAPEVSFAAAKALYAMGDPLGRKVLLGVLAGERSDTSGVLSTSIREAKATLHDPKAMLLMGVNSGAGFLGPVGMGFPIAERLMKDNQSSGRTAVALLLATDNSADSVDAIRGALEDKNWTVRAAATRAVAVRNIRSLAPVLATLLEDKRDEVRFAAAAATIRLKQGKIR